MNIEVWNDFCVPHRYTGETLLIRAIDELDLGERVKIRLRAFELDPGFPEGRTIDVRQCVARKYGCSLPEALEKIGYAENMARAIGIDMKFATAVFCNTRNAHRALKYVELDFGDEAALKLNFAFLTAYFTSNLVLDDANIVRVCGASGFDEDAVRNVLESGEYEKAVLDDEREARERGIYAIPYFDFAGKFAINGAASLDIFRQALERMVQSEGE